MANRLKPNDRVVGGMSAAQLLDLYARRDRHPKALATELVLASVSGLTDLVAAYNVPAELADAVRAELTRRRDALSRLLADRPALRPAARDIEVFR